MKKIIALLLALCLMLPVFALAVGGSETELRTQSIDEECWLFLPAFAQLDQLRELHSKDTQWLKEDIRLWRRIAFISMGIGLVLLALLLVYFTWTHLT